jgi:hypothetical protein
MWGGRAISVSSQQVGRPTPIWRRWQPRGVNRYRLRARLLDRLREERQAMTEAAEVELVERDGRVWQLRRLPSAVTE